MFFIIIWIISPIILIPWLIVSIVKGRGERKENEELRRQILIADREISALRNNLANSKVNQPGEYLEEDSSIPDSDSSVASEVVNSDLSHPEAAAVIREAEVSKPEKTLLDKVQSAVNKEKINTIFNRTENESSAVDDSKTEKKGLPSGTVLFGIGILFVLVAGAIFATTTWQILPAAGKVLTLLGAVSVFYISSFIAEKKLNLRETSITFYLLGSSFLSVINLGVAYFEWFGETYALNGQQAFIVWSISFLILAVCMFIGNKLYDMDLLGILSYLFLLTGIIMFALFLTDVESIVVLIAGIYIALSWIYIYWRKNQGQKVSFKKSVSWLSYIYMVCTLCALSEETHIVIAMLMMSVGIVIAVEISLLFFEDVKDIGILQIYSAVVAFLMPIKFAGVFSNLSGAFAFWCAAMIYALIFRFVKINKDRELGNAISDVASGVLLFAAIIGAPFNVETKSAAITIYILFIVAIGVFLTFIFLFKNVTRHITRIMDFINVDICLLGCTFASIELYALFDEPLQSIWLLVLVVIAIAVYVCFEMQETNFAGIIPMAIADIVIAYIAYDHSGNSIIEAVIDITLFVITIIAGRLRYKNIYNKDENGYHLDWAGLLSFILIIIVSYISGDYIPFIVHIMFAAYLVNYYKRVPDLLGKLLISLATVLIAYALYDWPFFEISRAWEPEWNITIFVLAVIAGGFIWKNIEKYYIRIAAILGALIYVQYLTDINRQIEYLSVGNTIYIVILKVLFYLAGAAILFGISIWRNSTACLIAVGVLLAHSSGLANSLISKWVIVLPVLAGIGYVAYVYYKNRKNQLIWPIIQFYMLLSAFDLPVFVFLIAFIVSIIYGYMSYDYVILKHDNGTEIDWFTITSLLPVLVVMNAGNDKWIFCGMMMLAVLILGFYNRIDANERWNNVILSFASVIVGLSLIKQPFFEISVGWRTEWVLLFAWIVIIFNFAFVYKDSEGALKYYILYYAAIASILWQGIDAVSSDNVVDALILGAIMVMLLLYSFLTRKKMWFLLAAVTLILQGIYTSRRFWLSIAWWVYLLVVGVALIAVAAANEYKKRNEIETKEMHLFSDWNKW